jgi:hypothetical protein
VSGSGHARDIGRFAQSLTTGRAHWPMSVPGKRATRLT